MRGSGLLAPILPLRAAAPEPYGLPRAARELLGLAGLSEADRTLRMGYALVGVTGCSVCGGGHLSHENGPLLFHLKAPALFAYLEGSARDLTAAPVLDGLATRARLETLETALPVPVIEPGLAVAYGALVSRPGSDCPLVRYRCEVRRGRRAWTIDRLAAAASHLGTGQILIVYRPV